MKFLKNLKAFSGFGRCTYLQIVVKEIELKRQDFIMDLQQGDEVIIPPQL